MNSFSTFYKLGVRAISPLPLFVACAVGLLVASGQALGADAASVRTASELKKAPLSDAATVRVLAPGTKLRILDQQGGWYKVRSGRRSGWVRMLDIRREQPRKGPGIDGLAARASGRAGTASVVSTIGIRGLSEEQLRAARYDEDELIMLDAYAASRDEAQEFARRGGLVARSLDAPRAGADK